MAIDQEYKERRVNNLPTSGLSAGDKYALNVGAGKYQTYIVSDTLQLVKEAGAEFIEKDTMAEMRALSAREIWALQNGYYKGVGLSGYYAAGDTPGRIEYYISSTSESDDGGSVIDVGSIKLEHIFEGIVDVAYFGAKASFENNKKYIQNAVNYTKKFDNKELRCEKKYYASNILVDNTIKINGSGSLNALDINYLTVQNPVSANSELFTPTDSIDNYEINDVLIFKGAGEDIVVVTGKTATQLQVKPLIFFYSVTETHVGFKYAQGIGSTYYKHQQILWVTSSLTEDLSLTNTVDNVKIDLDFRGSKAVNNDLNSIYQLTTALIWFFGTKDAEITGSSFSNCYTTPVYFYGYNTGQKVHKRNVFKDIGYTMPLSWEAQRRDATSGITMHWSQRFPAGDPRHESNVSSNYEVSGNTFIHCWNGGIFLSATKTGLVHNNIIDGFVSHGISVYGGDFGIASYGVKVYSNTILNGDTTGETGVLGAGIWVSVITLGTKVYDNSIRNCDIGLSVNFTQFSEFTNNTIELCKKSYIKLTGYVRNTMFTKNPVNVSPNTDSTATIVDIDSSLSGFPNANLVFDGNKYVVQLGWLGKPIYNLGKIGDLALKNESPLGVGNYMVNNGYTPSGGSLTYDKPLLERVNVRGISGSGATAGNSNRIEVIEKSNVITTNADFLGNYSYQGSRFIKESDTASQGVAGVVKQSPLVNNMSLTDLTAISPADLAALVTWINATLIPFVNNSKSVLNGKLNADRVSGQQAP